jgi:two-component system, cell cycle response regulator DivK
MARRTVLLIEDDAASQYIYTTALNHVGFEVWQARTAERAFEFLRERLPDVIVIDIGLPGMNGFDALERLKQDERTSAFPAIVVTVYVFPENQSRTRRAGCDVFLKKPLEPSRLIEEIRRMI